MELRECARPGCSEMFEPSRSTHKYHSQSCAKQVSNSRQSYGSGPAPVIPEPSEDDLIRVLQERGYRVEKPVPVEARVRLAPLKTTRYRIGVVSDTHLCSKFQQLTYLHEFFDTFSKEAVDSVLFAGDLMHGYQGMHRGMEYELFKFGATEQTDYAVDNFPSAPAPMYMIDGNHDLSHMKSGGTLVVRDFCDRREDATYLGSEGAFFTIGGANVYLWHGGSAAHAKSWNVQKWAESVAPEQKPHIMLDGHLHYACHVPAHRNIELFQLPCAQAQTPFEKRKRLNPVIGALILDLWVSKNGLEDLSTRWLLRRIPLEDDF